ncbi:alcohol dehydrogenase catalytic domain-containing protein [Nonomuraea sp. NPDC050022]|uniref:alcohol dehydrogenase catalytic domain-containing protein n=1 Tax=unclassified Nonomuraea TaxID=2593643 RepID=UPI0033E268CB
MVWLTEFGRPEVLLPGDAPDPVPGPGQMLIDVAYADITFVETQFRSGAPSPFKRELPMIPGNGAGGIVTAVGEGVDSALVSQSRAGAHVPDVCPGRRAHRYRRGDPLDPLRCFRLPLRHP